MNSAIAILLDHQKCRPSQVTVPNLPTYPDAIDASRPSTVNNDAFLLMPPIGSCHDEERQGQGYLVCLFHLLMPLSTLWPNLFHTRTRSTGYLHRPDTKPECSRKPSRTGYGDDDAGLNDYVAARTLVWGSHVDIGSWMPNHGRQCR